MEKQRSFFEKLALYTARHLITSENKRGEMKYGYNNVRWISKNFNRLKNFTSHRKRITQYKHRFDELLNENGRLHSINANISDGWLHLKKPDMPFQSEFIKAGEEIFRRMNKNAFTQKAYMTMMNTADDIAEFPSLLDFATSSDLLKIVGEYLKCVPVLTEISFYISEPTEGDATGSQLFHIDLEDTRVVRLIVPIEDITVAQGPFTFIPEKASTEAIRKLNYGSLKSTYRVKDDEMYKAISKDNLVVGTCEKGDLLFADTSRCFHYGSRGQTIPRKLCMLNYHSDIPENFNQTFGTGNQLKKYIKAQDTELRKMVLDYAYFPGK